MKWLRRFCEIVDDISDNGARAALWAVVVLVFIFCWEILLRSVFNRPTIWAHELSQYVFGFYFCLGAAYCLKTGAHVRVDIAVTALKPRTQAVIDMATGLVALIFMTALIWTSVEFAWDSVIYNEHSITPWGPPVYPLKTIVLLGSVMLGLQCVVKLIRDVAFGIFGSEL